MKLLRKFRNCQSGKTILKYSKLLNCAPEEKNTKYFQYRQNKIILIIIKIFSKDFFCFFGKLINI